MDNAISRREFLRLLAAVPLAGSKPVSLLESIVSSQPPNQVMVYVPREVPRRLPNNPDYDRPGGTAADFQSHLRDKDKDEKDINIGGIDLVFGDGVPVVSSIDGIVFEADWFDDAGWSVFVEFEDGQVAYSHLKEQPFVIKRQKVKRGQLLGRVGDTGLAKRRKHLHVSVALKREILEEILKNPNKYVIRDNRRYGGLIIVRVGDRILNIKDYGNRYKGTFSIFNVVVDPNDLTYVDPEKPISGRRLLVNNPTDYKVVYSYSKSDNILERLSSVVLTSPFIGHKDEVIKQSIEANGPGTDNYYTDFKLLVLAYYGRFMPEGRAMLEDMLRKLNLPQDVIYQRGQSTFQPYVPQGNLLVPDKQIVIPGYESQSALLRREFITGGLKQIASRLGHRAA
ncbi:M23 family metallopeptidase [Candidatus Woesearchaeota archaeon]|nr:M23 family metallopeptidase [Candidatus Woesearchaeota archaeon]